MNWSRFSRQFHGLWVLLGLVLVAGIFVVGRPHRSPRPLSIKHNGVHAPYNLRDDHGWLLMYNFRAVEPGVLYRSSGFPRNRKMLRDGKWVTSPAAFRHDQVFRFLRSKKIRQVINLQEVGPYTYYGEKGYFDYWYRKTGYRIQVRRLPVRDGHAYDLTPVHLMRYPMEERRFGLRAAAEFLELMKDHRPEDGAVLVHCDAGKDRTGVVVAAYELWRNQGWLPREELWRQVMERYLVSNKLIARDREAAAFSGGPFSCTMEDRGSWGVARGQVCPSWLEQLRPQLELIAQL